MKKGFTLVELMIVVAIIAILAAIAIPNLMQSRAQANEANAIAACKAYFSAQILFQRAGFGANELAGKTSATTPITVQPQLSAMYAAPYTALYGTNDGSGKAIALINAGMAAGRMEGYTDTIVTNAPTNANPPAYSLAVVATPAIDWPARSAYQGYVFADDTTRGNTFVDWCSGFGFFATPTNWSTTGYNTFWVGQAGVVYARNLRGNIADTAALVTAVAPASTSVETMISQGSTLWQMTR